MEQDNERYYGIAELAELAGVTRRTVRYYVQRGLLPTPLGTGRGPHYTPAHLERLLRIRQLQEAGVALVDIAAQLGGTSPAPTDMSVPLPAHSPWMRHVLADGVELHVRLDRVHLAPSHLSRLLEAVQQTLRLSIAPHPSSQRERHERPCVQLPVDHECHGDSSSGRPH